MLFGEQFLSVKRMQEERAKPAELILATEVEAAVTRYAGGQFVPPGVTGARATFQNRHPLDTEGIFGVLYLRCFKKVFPGQ